MARYGPGPDSAILTLELVQLGNLPSRLQLYSLHLDGVVTCTDLVGYAAVGVPRAVEQPVFHPTVTRARKGDFGQYHCKFVKFGKPP